MWRWAYFASLPLLACGGSTPTSASKNQDGGTATVVGDAAPNANADASATGATSTLDAGDDCTTKIEAVLNRGCARCWPAFRDLCTKGNPDVVEGLAVCLTSDGVCWDVSDPNTAPPCMQQVIDANSTAAAQSVHAKLLAMNCGAVSSESVLAGDAIVAAMTVTDQKKLDACLTGITSCTDPRVAQCFKGESWDPSLCKD